MSSEDETYRIIPLSTEIHHGDFYTYGNVRDFADKCEVFKENIIKCRTVGILQSQHGHFFLGDMDGSGIQSELRIQVSMTYLKTPPQSTVIPYPVQIFGTLQWRNRPVIFAKILQVLNVPMAIRIGNIMSNIVDAHLATSLKDLLFL